MSPRSAGLTPARGHVSLSADTDMHTQIATTATLTPLATRAKLFRGFSDASRLSILEALRSGPRNVSDIVDETGLGQSNVSNHLACLLDCGLVAREQRGRFMFYSLSDPRVDALLRTVDELLAEVAVGVEACRRYEALEAG
jgi:DNA-binding transcriptional ArsR family regulator